MHTVTFSLMECAAAKRHLELQRDRLPSGHKDVLVLGGVIHKFTVCNEVTFTRAEVFCTLLYLRRQAAALCADMMALEERQMRGGHNGDLFAQHRALDAESMFLANVIRILWTFTHP